MKLKMCCLISLLVLGAGAVSGQTRRRSINTNNTLAIWVKGPTGGQPSGLVRVELFRGEMPLEEVYCDSRGQYTFFGLEDATYAVRVSLPGFKSQLQEVRLNGGARRQVFIRLIPGNDAEWKETTKDADPTVSVRWLSAPEKARKEVIRARGLRRREDYKGAVKHLQRAVKIDPTFVIAHNELGLSYWKLNKLDKARQSYETCIRLDPDFLIPYLNLAEVFSQQKSFNQAGRILLQASRAHPHQGEPYYTMAKIQFNTGHLDRAEQACKLALERDHSKIPEVHILLANIYLRRGDLTKMKAELEAYLAQAPQGPQAESARATLEKIKQELKHDSALPPKAL